jgi:4-hydroxybenzoate polyprenyltransferase
MKLIGAFFSLVRWPNLFFIALTQFLFFHRIGQIITIENPYNRIDISTDKNNFVFYLLMLASLLIAAAGYIINDYFDLQIDAINKPQKLVVEKKIKRRWAIVWHLAFSFTGILISGYVSYKTSEWLIVLINAASVLLLWFYTTKFKKQLLVGNIIIAGLTAWVIIVVFLFCRINIINHFSNLIIEKSAITHLYKITLIYSGFAFVISIIREVIKDLEDIQGDEKFNCKTMPIVWGVPVTKVYTAVWIIVAVITMLILLSLLSSWLIISYSILLIIIPMTLVLMQLKRANLNKDYHQISNELKLIMLAGILTMLFY